jgi:dephospho-CoA kinase
MTVLGLTGTFGSGKSTVASMFKSFGAIVIDADEIAKEVVAPRSDALREIVEIFGNDVLLRNGSLDRKKLGSIAFRDGEKLALLNQIIHPRVRTRELELLERYKDNPLVVLEVPLLLENRMESLADTIAVVTISDEKRLERLQKREEISPELVQRVLSKQWDQDRKVEKADFVINNNGSVEETERQVREIVHRIAPQLVKQ